MLEEQLEKSMPYTWEPFKKIERGQCGSLPRAILRTLGAKQPKGKHALAFPVCNVDLVSLDPLWYTLMEECPVCFTEVAQHLLEQRFSTWAAHHLWSITYRVIKNPEAIFCPLEG